VSQDLDQHLTVVVRPAGDEIVFALAGELDPHTAPQLQEELDAVRGVGHGGTTFVLDLGELTFIDSSGLRVLISAQKEIETAGGRLVLRRPSATAHRLLEITGLVDHLEVEP
jgi:anti-sigma B factor antagonist